MFISFINIVLLVFFYCFISHYICFFNAKASFVIIEIEIVDMFTLL